MSKLTTLRALGERAFRPRAEEAPAPRGWGRRRGAASVALVAAVLTGAIALPATALADDASDLPAAAVGVASAGSDVEAAGAQPIPALGSFVKYRWSPAIFRVVSKDVSLPLTPQDWNRLGQPAPRVVPWVPGSAVIAYATNSKERYVSGPTGSDHRFTSAEFAAAGRPAVDVRQSFGFVERKSSGVVYFCGTGRFPTQVPQYIKNGLGHPTPVPVSTLGDYALSCPTA